MRVLVCGGRGYGGQSSEHATLIRTLNGIHAETPITVVIHGDAKGADRMARAWAISVGVPHLPFPADWYPNGPGGGMDRGAGPKRNSRMLADGKPDLVVAFPGGTGMADCVRKARAGGVKVLEIREGTS